MIKSDESAFDFSTIFLSINQLLDLYLLFYLISTMILAIALIITFFLLREKYISANKVQSIIKNSRRWLLLQYAILFIALLIAFLIFIFDLSKTVDKNWFQIFTNYYLVIISKILIALMNSTSLLCLMIISMTLFLIFKITYNNAKEENRRNKSEFKRIFLENRSNDILNLKFEKMEIKKLKLSYILALFSVFVFATLYFFSRDYQIQQSKYLTTDQCLFLQANILLFVSIYYFNK